MALESAITPPRAPSCCTGMIHYSTNPPRVDGQTRFDDGECLVHVAQDGQIGLILHDESGRFVIIRYCPWCGASLTGGGPAVAAVPRDAERQAAPGSRSHHKKKTSDKPERRPMSQAQRDALAERMRAMHERKRLERQRAALAPGHDEVAEE